MNIRHQTRYVARAAMKRSLALFKQAVEDFPFVRTARDQAMHDACTASIRLLEAALVKELDDMPED